MLDPITLALGISGGSITLALLWDALFIVRQKNAAIIERLGKFESTRGPGLNLKLPLIDRVVANQNLRIQQLDVDGLDQHALLQQTRAISGIAMASPRVKRPVMSAASRG